MIVLPITTPSGTLDWEVIPYVTLLPSERSTVMLLPAV